MALNKKLIHFKNKENFDKEVANENILDTSIVFIQDSKEISTHGTVYKTVNWSILGPAPALLCDIAYWNGNKVKTISQDKWDNSLGTPIGVVVIPSGMLPDGKARMIGLKSVDSSGNASTSHVSMTWGGYGTDTSLTNFNRVPITDNSSFITSDLNKFGYLPSDKFIGTQSFVDTKAKYLQTSYFIPSPYLDDTTMNPAYSKTISDYNNALSNFNGLSNTQTLVELGSDYEAANAAWKYNDGVSSTLWYLPAMGELGFLMPRFNAINAAITAVGGVAIDDAMSIWSSSEYTSNHAYNLHTNSGDVIYNLKDNYSCVYPFGML